MARKSAKNKDGTPDKPVSTRKSTRTTRRRKKSTSESEPEMEVPPKKETKREEKPETSDAHTRLRRSARTKNTPEVEVAVKPVEEKPAKEEDDTIWESQPTKVEENEKAENEGEGASTWKVQSSNGSGGEIQKLKICRQRLTDSNESSSSPTKETLSPRKKRYTKRATKDKHDVEDAESTGSPHTDPEPLTIEAVPQPTEVPEPEPVQETVETKPEEPEEVIAEVVQAEEIQIEEIETEKAVENLEKIEETPIIEEASDVQEPETVEVPVQEEIVQETEIIEEVQEPPVAQQDEKIEETIVESSKIAEPEAKPQLELADEMEEIAKKLNERAAAKGAKETEEKVEQKTTDLEISREEGEIVSEAPTPEAPAKIKPTIIVNKPEIKPKPPTVLKRLVDDDEPSSQRKRRTSKASKSQKDSQISISSTTLKTLVPDVTPVPLEEVKELLTEKHGSPPKVGSERKRGHRDSSEEPGELVSESGERSPSPEPKKPSLEPSKVSERRKSSQDEEKKEPKKKIVIKHKDDTPTNQENHKATRKISIIPDEAKAVRKSPSPPAKKPSNVLFITNLVRPFTVPQLKELLARTGTIENNGFYIDKIKSKCYVKYTELDMAIETRQALHGVRWPVNNPKTLKVDFSTEQNLNAMLRLAEEEHNAAIKQEAAAIDRNERFEKVEKEIVKAPLIEKSISKASRKVSSIREWDMGKNENQPPNQVEDNKNDEWAKGKERKDSDIKRRALSPAEADTPRKMKKKDQAAPAKLLDGLFKKTKAAPCIYWLPLTTAQIAVKEEMRRQHMAEHERRLAQAEQRKTEMRRSEKRRDSKDGIRERDRDRDREREKERERDRKRK